MSGTTIDPTTRLTVTLAATSWNGLFMLANEGLQVLSGIVGDAQRQCMTQAKPQPPDEAEHIPMRVPGGLHRPNGEAPV